MAYFGGDTRQIIPELGEVKPDYIPSVPRIFEKLYAMGTSQIPPDQMEEVRRAVEAGVEIRAREIRGESVPPELREPFDPVDERLFKPVRELFGGQVREATTGAAPIAAEILEFFYAAGVPVMEGYGMTESTGLGALQPTGAVPLPDRRAPARGRRGDDRRGRRDPDARRPRLLGLLAERGGHEGGPRRRRLAAHRRSRRDRRGRLRLHHRPQEGHHHHGGRQEPRAGQRGERPQAVPVHLPGRDVRRPAALPRRAHHAGRGGDPPLGPRTRPAGSRFASWPRTTRSAASSRASSTTSTPSTPRSNRSSASPSSITTSTPSAGSSHRRSRSSATSSTRTTPRSSTTSTRRSRKRGRLPIRRHRRRRPCWPPG